MGVDSCPKTSQSPSQKNRKKFQEIKKTKETIALVVDTVDRLQRSFRESVIFDELRKEGKVEIHFLRENLVVHQNSNSADIQRWDMAVLFAKSYVLNISDNVKRTFESMRGRGEVTGKPPIGYISEYQTIIDHRGKERQKRAGIRFDELRAPIIRRLFELYEMGQCSIKTLWLEAKKMGADTTERS